MSFAEKLYVFVHEKCPPASPALPVNIREILSALVTPQVPRVEIRMIAAHVLQQNSGWLVAHDDDALSGEQRARIEALTARRGAGEPMAYLLGEREFFGRIFRCSPAALIPRPETEHVVEHVLALVDSSSNPTILDVGTGTGCIALTLALERPNARIIALDISSDALALARQNATHLGTRNVEFMASNWFSAVAASSKFDFIVSNPPYIAPGDAHLSRGDLRFEPTIALADAVDGLESYRQLACGAMMHLKSGGWLIVEHGYDQGESVPSLMAASGLAEVSTHCDLAGHPRVTAARRPE